MRRLFSRHDVAVWALGLALVTFYSSRAWEADPLRFDEPVTLDFENADIREVLRAIGATYGISIVIDPSVSGTVTFHVTGVPLLQSLRSVVSAAGLRLEWRDEVALVLPGNTGERLVVALEDGRLRVEASNADVRAVVQEVARLADLNVVVDPAVQGALTGTIFGLPPVDALRGLLRGNGFVLRAEGSLFRVFPRAVRPAQGVSSSSLDIVVDDSLVYLDVESADVGAVIREIASQSGVNLITYGSIAGEISARVDGMSVDETLSVLLRGTRYSFKREGSLLLVGDAGPQSPSAALLVEPRLYPLRYSKATDAIEALPGTLPATQVKVVKTQNALLVTGARDVHERMRIFLAQYDRQCPQVMIEALVVELSKNASTTLGLRAGLFGQTTGRELWPHLAGEVYAEDLNPTLDDIARWLRVDSFGRLPDNFTVQIEALESRGDAKIKARPRVVTLSGHEAAINVGWVRWYKTSTGNVEAPITRLHSIDAGISLSIIPWVSDSGQVTVELHPVVSNLKGFGPEGLPEIARRTVDTTVRLSDGETVVIGGLIQSGELENVERVPVLGHLPLLGALFSHRTKTEDMSELVIFITPRLVQGEESCSSSSVPGGSGTIPSFIEEEGLE